MANIQEIENQLAFFISNYSASICSDDEKLFFGIRSTGDNIVLFPLKIINENNIIVDTEIEIKGIKYSELTLSQVIDLFLPKKALNLLNMFMPMIEAAFTNQ
ncbi:MAG: hypothetical protein JXR68_13075 [Bacteroidales bacterium]|nr:hypothetical protein [Bacteroidales bacterium]